MTRSQKGFSLIELLMVIAIIGLLSSVVLGQLSTARGRARDAKVRSDLHQIQVAMQFYYNQNSSFPPNPTPGFASLASTALVPLVTQKFLPSVPASPDPTFPYYYYDYGTGNPIGTLVSSQFTGTAASTGYGGSCRPFASGSVGYCEASSNTYYCVCLPY